MIPGKIQEAHMRVLHHTLEVATPGRGLVPITSEVARWLASQRPADGLLTLFIRHTSASLLVQENADPDVRGDLERFFARLVKDGDPLFAHDAEGPDDMPSHVRAALTQTQLSIPVIGGRPALGTWQGIYVYEHRTRPHRREVVLHYVGA
jgi:secondary thiamine-phosphate synthase enzyme